MGEVKQINIKNLLFLQPHDQYQEFWAKLVKNWQKIIQKHWYLQH